MESDLAFAGANGRRFDRPWSVIGGGSRRPVAIAALLVVATALVLIVPLQERAPYLAIPAALSPLVLLTYAWERARIRGQVDLLDAGVAGAIVLLAYFGLRALIVTFVDDRLIPPVVENAGDAARTEAMLAVIVGSLAVWLGFALVTELVDRRAAPRWPSLTPRVAVLMGSALAAAGAPPLAIQSSASQSALLGHENTLGAISGAVNVLSTLPFYGVVFLGLALGRDRRVWVLWGALVLALVSIGVLSLFKEIVILTAICAVVPIHYRLRPMRPWFALALAALFILLLVPGVSALRQAKALGDSNAEALWSLPAALVTQDLADGSFERMPAVLAPWRYAAQSAGVSSRRLSGTDAVIAVTRLTPSPNKFQQGDTLIPLAAGPIPRIIWPDKPKTGLGRWFTRRYWARGTTNTSAQPISVIGEGYANFGLLGVVLILASLGAAWRIGTFVANPRRPSVGLLAYPFILFAVLAVERNVAYTAVNLGQRLAPLALILPISFALQRQLKA